ncbi:conserved hypothetical protein [Ricinus communis]|uniref:Uncharacterized protein n=1 Tax=Ricinus communis TaxID=3988 RepID=B9TEK1_RICCO|nr:conserved hypothetical protein [Ricinus communis]
MPKGVLAPVLSRGQSKNLLQDLQVVRNAEGVARIFMGEERIEVVEPRPGDCRKAHGARFVRGEKDQILRSRSFCGRLFGKALESMDLAMPQRTFRLIVRFRQYDGVVVFSQQGGAEDLVAARHALLCQRQHMVLKCGQKCIQKQVFISRSGHACHPSRCQKAGNMRSKQHAKHAIGVYADRNFLIGSHIPFAGWIKGFPVALNRLPDRNSFRCDADRP